MEEGRYKERWVEKSAGWKKALGGKKRYND
jgi:hypothetical protein